MTYGFVFENLFYWIIFAGWLPILSTRVVLLDSFTWLSPHFVRESRSIGQFHLIEPPFCPRESFYWTVLLGWGSILSARAVLLDSFTWLSHHFVHESRSIGQFHLVEAPFCPREPFYWTVSPGWATILSVRVALLDSFTWLRLHFVRESRSIGQFHLIEPPFCPREPFYWTVSLGWATILSARAVLLDSFTWLSLHFVHESRSIGQFYLVEARFCPRESFGATEKVNLKIRNNYMYNKLKKIPPIFGIIKLYYKPKPNWGYLSCLKKKIIN